MIIIITNILKIIIINCDSVSSKYKVVTTRYTNRKKLCRNYELSSHDYDIIAITWHVNGHFQFHKVCPTSQVIITEM